MSAHVRPAVVTIYAVLCLAAAAWAGYQFIWHAGTSELAAIPLVVLGLPWSVAGVLLSSGVGGASGWIAAGSVVGGCVLNGWLLGRLARRR